MFTIYVGLRTMADQIHYKTFENWESDIFSFDSVLSSDNIDPDKNCFNFSISLQKISE